MQLLNNFILYGFFGFLLEISFCFISGNNLISGILYGPFTPIYGVGILIIIFINNYLNKYNLKWYIKNLLLFILSAILLGLIELLGGYFIEIVFNKVFWNYSALKYSIFKYTSLEMMSIWGMLSLIFVYLLKPITDKIIKKIPLYLTLIILLLIIIDYIITFIIKIF